AARLERVPKGRQCRLEACELLVDRNPQGLEGAGKVSGARAGPEHCPDRVDDIIAGGKRRAPPAPDDLPRQRARPALVSILVQNLRQLGLRGGIEQVRRRRSPAAHPHVQHRTGTKGESPLELIELAGGYAEV